MDMGVNWTRVMFGDHALHVPVQMVVQDAGRSGGLSFCSFVGFAPAELRSAFAVEHDYPQELIIGDLVIRARSRHTGRDHVGAGLSALVTSLAMEPDGWSVDTPDLRTVRR